MKQVVKVIQAYEKGEVDFDQAKAMLLSLTGKTVEQCGLDNYWRAESLENFARRLAIQPIKDWQQIDDNQAIGLLEEILQNVADDVVLNRNGEALEKRYGKSEGSVSEYIFQQDITEPEQLLEKLKEDTRIKL